MGLDDIKRLTRVLEKAFDAGFFSAEKYYQTYNNDTSEIIDDYQAKARKEVLSLSFLEDFLSGCN